jgi:O-antigen/teichoic acid export membrane protein
MASRTSRLRLHLRVPLYRSAYALTLSALGSAAVGTLYWALASRLYSAEVVGVSSAAVAALTFLSGVAGLYLDGALFRFLPRAGDMTGRLIRTTFAVTIAAAVIASSVFLIGIDVWTPELSFARSSGWSVLATIGGIVTSCLLILEDGALTGLRRASWVPLKNMAYNTAKIPLVALLASFVPKYGILIAWLIPGFIVAPIVYLLTRPLVSTHRDLTRLRQEQITAGQVAHYAAGNYVGYLCTLAYRTLPPLVVLHEAGARSSAFFYPPWLIAITLSLVMTNFSISLVVEGAFDPERLALHTRQAAKQAARLLLPIAAVLFLAAPYVLRLFGAEYADQGSLLLRLMAVGLIPSSICILSFGLARVQDHVRTLILNQILLAALVLGLSMALIPSLGITGVGVAWLAAQTAVAVPLFLMELRPVWTTASQ